jgi:hypothetical protein
MSDEIRHADGGIEHPDVSREETDASFRAILFLLIGAAGVAVVIYVGVSLFFYGWRDHENAVKKSSFPLAPKASTDPRVLSPLPAGEPRLEQVDRLAGVEKPNVYDRQAAKEKVLNSSGPTEEKGYVHIPIEQAMKLLEDKLPVRAKPPADEAWRADGLIDAGESNSGREFRGKKR